MLNGKNVMDNEKEELLLKIDEINNTKQYKTFIENNLFFDIKNNFLVFLIKDEDNLIDYEIIKNIYFEKRKLTFEFQFNSISIKLNNETVDCFSNLLSKYLFVILDENAQVSFVREII